MELTRQRLLTDLYIAFGCARKHKGNTSYVRRFERNLKENMEALCEALFSRTYKARPSKCFIIDYPKKREVFAADFVDRIVHHLYFNYTHELYERTFIHDTYSCIKDRGTHYGIERLRRHILGESQNYTHPCYVLKLDIRGYFMHIDRHILLSIALDTLKRYETKEEWAARIDFDFVRWLTREIIMLDPRGDCTIVGGKERWEGLDKNKSLFGVEEGQGMPIGNLTSQLFSNVYLNVFDQWMKRKQKCRHYGRYVDDAYVVSGDKDFLYRIAEDADTFLRERLHLSLNKGKTTITDARHGVEFLGAFILPYRTYVSNDALRRMRHRTSVLQGSDTSRSVNSYLGVLSHYSSYNIRHKLFFKKKYLINAPFNNSLTKQITS